MKIMSPLLSALVLITSLTIGLFETPALAQSQAPAFLSVIEDLPLMPGLSEDTEGAMSFDTANGRIAEATALGQAESIDVIDYYKQVLPQLGWKRVSSTTYRREEETLIIDVEKSDGTASEVAVHFRLSPTKMK